MLRRGTALPASDGLLIAQARELIAVLHRARPHVELLADGLDETVGLCVLDGPHVVYFLEAERGAGPRPESRRGQWRLLGETAAGIAIAAGLPEASARRLVRGGSTRACDVQRVQRRGYALRLEHGERAQDVLAVSVALPATCLSAALEVRAPLSRLPGYRVREVADCLHHAGLVLAAALRLS